MRRINKFPIIQAIPIIQEKSTMKKMFKFGTFRRRYRVIEDYFCWCTYLKKRIFIPKNFIFDGASIPKVINGLYSPTGVLFYGALPHDFGYKFNGLLLVESPRVHLVNFQKFSKNKLDKIFKELCIQENGMKFGSSVATFALKLFGSFAWEEHRKNNSNLKEEHPFIFF